MINKSSAGNCWAIETNETTGNSVLAAVTGAGTFYTSFSPATATGNCSVGGAIGDDLGEELLPGCAVSAGTD